MSWSEVELSTQCAQPASKLHLNSRPVVCEFLPGTKSDNTAPQETTAQGASDMGIDGSRWSCPGGSLVAEERVDGC
jgi:hypothetical protein